VECSELGITKAVRDALIRVAARLRSGEFFHFKTPAPINYREMYSVTTRGSDPRIFDMSLIGDYPCGKVGCIMRWTAEEMGCSIMQLCSGHWFWYDARALQLYGSRSRHYTPEMAADAIDNFLETGNPSWREL
jgi:hypothetical protein